MFDNKDIRKRRAIGFVGLGLMGSAMVERLQQLKYKIYVLANNSRENIEVAVKRGASEVLNGFDLASKSDIIMICVNTSETVEKLIYGNNGIKTGVKKGTIIIDFGTSKPLSTKKIANDLKNIGVGYVDAPVGRTPLFAREGRLNIMGDISFSSNPYFFIPFILLIESRPTFEKFCTTTSRFSFDFSKFFVSIKFS